MIQRFQALLAASLGVLLGASSVHAVINLTADITNDQENPPAVPTLQDGVTPRPASFGTATFQINDAGTAMTMSAEVFNIDFTGSQTADTNDNLAAAHIHSGANTPPANNGVVWGFFGSPFHDTVIANVVVTPFATGVGGTVTGVWDEGEGSSTVAAQLSNILAGRAYINFHTNQFSGGEIRGALVPEPSSALLLTVASAGLAAVRRRRVH